MVKAIAPTNSCAEWLEAPTNGASGSASFEACLTDTIALSTSAFTTSTTADKQYALYREVCGEGEILIHVNDISPSGGFAGLELREDTTAGAKKFGLKTQLSSQIGRFYRSTANGSVTHQNQTIQNIRWLKLTRSGNSLTAHVSTTGQSWTQVMSQTISMDTCILAGIFAHSYNTTTTITSTFDCPALSGFTAPSGPSTTVFFMQDTLIAHAGDTIQICVGIANPCVCSPTSVEVALQGNDAPHLTGYETQTITFDVGDTVLCFSQVINAVEEFRSYEFALSNAEGGNGTQIVDPQGLILQVEPVVPGVYCGEAPAPVNQPETPDVMDRFGYGYGLDQLKIDTTNGGGSQPRGFTGCDCLEEFNIELLLFDLWFEDCRLNTGTGFGAPGTLGEDRRRVACQVFAELEAILIPQVEAGCGDENLKVNIQIQPSQITPELNLNNLMDPNMAGYASALYLPEQGLIAGVPWRIINSNSLPLPRDDQFYHGYIRINFDSPQIDYWLDYTQAPTNLSQTDLYTVMWHEAVHVLDFSSFLRVFGNRTFFLYDEHLWLDYGVSEQTIIEEHANWPLRWDFATGLGSNHPDLFSSCQNNTGTTAPDMIFRTTSGDIPVFANNSTLLFQIQSHSHLNISCDNTTTDDYLMNFFLPTGIRRNITQDEMDILCEIGYTLDQENGYSCGCTVSGVDDYGPDCDSIYRISICDEQTIYPEDLLANDHPNTTAIEDLFVINPHQGIVTPDGNGNFIFTPHTTGLATLAYIPTGCDGRRGNATYVYIQVYNDFSCLESECNLDFSCEDVPEYLLPLECVENQDCLDSPCNVLCNPGFCGMINSYFGGATADFGVIDPSLQYFIHHAYVPSWIRTQGSPDLFIISPGESRIRIVCDNTTGNTEGIMSYVDFTPDQNYLLSININSMSEMVDASSLNVDIIAGEQLDISPLFDSEPAYNGPRQQLITQEQTTGPVFSGRLGACFAPEDPSLNALWIYIPGMQGTLTCFIDFVELVEDNFSAGPDQTSDTCGMEIRLGDAFCMLSDVGICYEWFVVGENNELTPVASYEVLNGVIDEQTIVGNIDEETQELIVSPYETTTYALQRTICDGGGLNEDFELCYAYDEVTVTVTQMLLDPGFTAIVDSCDVFLVPNETEGDHLWQSGEVTSTMVFSDFGYLVNGTYPIIHTITNECGSQSDTLAVVIDDCCEAPAPDAGFSALTFCLFASFTAGPTEGEHDWDFGGAGTLTGTEDMPVFEYEQGGTYQVIHTVTNVCGQIDADTIAVTVEDCAFSDLDCECEDAFVLDVGAFNPPQSAMNLSFFTGVINLLPDDFLTDACVIIRGQLIVDEDYEINESEVLMEEGAEIVVAPHSRFSLSGMNATQKVHGCEYMWKGITVQTDGHFIAKQAWIEDAHYAVRPLDKSRVDISSSTFIDNYVGLYFEGPYVFELDPFYGNTFATDDDLLPAYAGQTPAPGLRSFAGIEVVDRYNLLHIGVAGAPENVFENLRSGIVTRNTPLFVERSRFLGMEITSSEPTYPFTGYGIRHEGGAAHPLTVLGFGASGQTAFEYCTDAVWAQGTDTKVNQSRMTDVARGVQVRLAQQRTIEMSYNYIACASRGILLLHNDPAALISLHHNTIHAGSASPLSKAIGIMVSEQGIAQNQATIGPRNIVQTYGYDMGIYLGSANGYVVSDNEITLNHSTSSLYGIAARDALNSTIELNYIEGAATSSGTGIDVLSSTGMAYSCNTLHSLHTGMHLNGTCTDTDIRGNTFEPPFVDGLHYGSLLDINAQLHRGNQWLSGTYSGAAARNDIDDDNLGIPIDEALSLMRFEVHDDQSAYYPPGFAFPNLQAPFGSFINAWFPETFGSPWDCEDQLIGDEREKIREIDIPVALGTAPTGDYEEARRWGARQQLYRKVVLQGGETDTLVVDSFYVSQSDSLLGLLYEIEAGKQHLFGQSETEQQQVVALSHDRDSLVQRLAALDSMLVVAEEDVWALRDTLLEKAGLLFLDIDSLDQLIKAEIYAAAENLAEDNESLESAKGYAQNELDVNALYLSTLASGMDTFSSVQLSALGSIAEQCPYSNGRPVYKARHLLHLPYPDSLRVDPGCYQALAEAEATHIAATEKERRTVATSPLPLDWKVYPNPARKVLQIEIVNATPVTIALLDMHGRVLLTQQAEEAPLGQNLTFDISGLNSGMYLLELNGWSISRQLKKVVIMK